MSLEVIAAGGCYGVQLVVGEGMAELSARRGKRVIESVAGIVHLIYSEDRFQATLVKTGIVGYEGNGGYLPITHHDHTHGANARRLLVGRLEVDGDKVSNHALISQILTDKHYDMPTLVPAVTQEVDVAANALRRVAVMASAVDPARGIDVEPLGIDG